MQIERTDVYDSYTGSKINYEEFTIFYNIAYFRVAGVINHLLGNPYEINKENLEKQVYKKDEASQKFSWEQNKKVLSGLGNFLWKSNRLAKNTNGYITTTEDELLIVQMINKMMQIRNFHSHFYHDNSVLGVTLQFKKTIEAFRDKAKRELMSESQNAFALTKYEVNEKRNPFFNDYNDSYYFTKEGRTFFLSFFLTQGEMSRFLSQRKGFERTDTPIQKIKRKIFSFYSQRDGAARQHFGHDENILSTMSEEEQKGILSTRQAYKLISYLNDVPPVSNDIDLFPLFIEGKHVSSAEDYNLFCNKHGFFSGLSILPAVKIKEDVHNFIDTTQIPLDNFIDLKFDAYKIRMSKNTFHKLILDIFRSEPTRTSDLEKLKKAVNNLTGNAQIVNATFYKHILDAISSRIKDAVKSEIEDSDTELNSTLNYFVNERMKSNENFNSPFYEHVLNKFLEGSKDAKALITLAKFIAERERLSEIVNTTQLPKTSPREKLVTENGKFTLTDEIDLFYRFKHRNEYLGKQIGLWLENKLGTKEFNSLLKFKTKIKTEPIEINYHDYYFEADEKPRANDLFVKYTCQYLIDFKIVPTWHFMFETFGETKTSTTENNIETTFTPKTRTTVYSNSMPENYRLALTDENQIVIGIYTSREEENKSAGIPPKNKFLIGAKALKNLLIGLVFQNRPIDNFFNDIIADTDRIRNANGIKIEYSDLKILKDKNYLPQSFKLAMQVETVDLKTLKDKAKSRIEHLIKELREIDANAKKLSKAEKNRQIMRCYKYFDWEYADGGKYKFLRKNEYQQMSVYHYCKKEGDSFNKNKNLIADALNHTPEAVQNLLKNAKDIDDLLTLTIEDTTSRLNSWLEGINGKHFKEKGLKPIFSKLGISMYKTRDVCDCVTDLNFDHKKQLDKALCHRLPFDIHPMLPLEVFYAAELSNARKLSANESDPKLSRNTKFSLTEHTKLLKNPKYQKGLRSSHYNFNNYLKTVPEMETKKIKHEIVGAMNELLVRDILLWEITKNYLRNISSAHQTYLTAKDKKEDWHVNYLRKSAIKIPFREIGFKNTDLLIKFHQLDDYLFVESKNVVQSALKQTLKRFKKQRSTDEAAKELKTEITDNGGKFYTTKIENDSRGYCVPYSEVFKEMQRVINESLRWVPLILKWEKSIVDKMTQTEIERYEQNKSEQNYSLHINFQEIVEQGLKIKDIREALEVPLTDDFLKNEKKTDAPTLKDLLVVVRNKTFHTEIPDTNDFSYWELEKNTPLIALLNWQPKEYKTNKFKKK